jgi:hypothetical protein
LSRREESAAPLINRGTCVHPGAGDMSRCGTVPYELTSRRLCKCVPL